MTHLLAIKQKRNGSWAGFYFKVGCLSILTSNIWLETNCWDPSSHIAKASAPMGIQFFNTPFF